MAKHYTATSLSFAQKSVGKGKPQKTERARYPKGDCAGAGRRADRETALDCEAL